MTSTTYLLEQWILHPLLHQTKAKIEAHGLDHWDRKANFAQSTKEIGQYMFQSKLLYYITRAQNKTILVPKA